MQIIYIPGVWDLLHVGHVAILEKSSALGDKLIVGVPSDQVVLEDKRALPIIPLRDRITMLESLSCTDVVVPYYRLEFVPHLKMFKPDILVVGETWGTASRHVLAEEWAKNNGCRVVTMPYCREECTTDIKQRISDGIKTPRLSAEGKP
jgi:cytidyltransferase-like protein